MRTVKVDLIKASKTRFRERSLRMLLSGVQERDVLLSSLESMEVLKRKFFNAYQSKDIEEVGRRRILVNDSISGYELATSCARIVNLFDEQVSEYNTLRDEYERCLVNRELEEGLACLEQIEAKIGFSFWGLGQKLLLLGIRNKKEAAALWKASAQRIEGQATFLFLLDHLKTLSDLDVSYAKYVVELDKHLGSTTEDVRRYMESKLRIDRIMSDEDASLVLQIDLQISLIDLYLSYEAYLVSNGESIFHERDTKRFRRILPKHDAGSPVIKNVKILIGDYATPFDSEAMEAYKIIDLYSQGKYESAIACCQSYLLRLPQDFQIACVLSKSIIHLGADLYNDLPQYIHRLHSLYSLDEEMEKSSVWLQTEMRRCYGIGLGIKIRSFLLRKNILEGDNPFCYPSFLLDRTINPNSVWQIDATRTAAAVDFFEQCCPTSIKAIAGMLFGLPDQCQVSSDPTRNCIARIRSCCKASLLNEAERELRTLDVLCQGRSLYYRERYLQLKMLYLRSANMYSSAVRLLVDSFFENEQMFRRVLNKTLVKLDFRTRNVSVMKDVNHIILTYLMYPLDYGKLIIVYDNFLDSNNIDRVDACIALANKEDNREKILFFLDKVCTIDLLRMDYRLFEDGIAPETERLYILQCLDHFDHRQSYTEEMFELKKLESIRSKLKDIKSGKINADTDKIFQLKNEEWVESFEMFLEVKRHIGDTCYVRYSPSEKRIGFASAAKEGGVTLRNMSPEESARLVMSDLIASMMGEFLYNPQFGLETYLSARIRHGYCKGQLMTFLQNLDLIAIHDRAAESFSIDRYWREACDGDDAIYDIVRTRIIHITRVVEMTINEILSDWLRIKVTDSERGMFDYRILFSSRSIDQYLEIMEEHEDFNQLCREAVDLFWYVTNRNLESIRSRIDGELKAKLIGLLDDTTRDLSECQHVQSGAIDELRNRCNMARHEVIVALREFKDAFVHSSTEYQDFTLGELGECVHQTIGRQYDIDEVNWTTEADGQVYLRGKYFLPFVDVLCILVDNAIDHSGIYERRSLEIDIRMGIVGVDYLNPDAVTDEMKKHKRYVTIAVGNNIDTSLNPSEVEGDLRKAFDSVGTVEKQGELMQKEGGTGLHKLCNIIEYQISWLYYTEYCVDDHNVLIQCVICADKLLKEASDEDIID